MLDANSFNGFGPVTKEMLHASGHAPELCQLLEFYSNMVGKGDFDRVMEQIETILAALLNSQQLVCYTYDDEMVVPNLMTNLLQYSGYLGNETDIEVTYTADGKRLALRYADHDDDGQPCASILVNQ